MNVTEYSDDERARLARPSKSGRTMLGPDECCECPDHPGFYDVYRWFWDAGADPTSADAEYVDRCPKCDEDEVAPSGAGEDR